MLIRHVTADDLNRALAVANEQFGQNIGFKRADHAGLCRDGTAKYNVSLKVINTRAAVGVHMSRPDTYNGGHRRRTALACWHVHRAFLDALPHTAEVISVPFLFDHGTPEPWHPGEPHRDWNTGTDMYPYYMSEACNCDA